MKKYIDENVYNCKNLDFLKGDRNMRENMQSVAKEYTKRNHWRKIWRRIAGGLACVVVFCTIYALMLPALTLESETICGLEEHTHTEECYRQIFE